MYGLAGFVGVNPDPFTFHELSLMVRGKHKEQWQHTASILAMTANTVRDPKKKRRPFSAEDFYPTVFVGRKKAEGRVPISILKSVFMANRNDVPREDTSRRGGDRSDSRG